MAPSINRRLLASVLLFIVLALGLSGYALDQTFRNSTEAALAEKLKAHFYALLAASDDLNGEMILPEQLSDPLFNQIDSGLYALITNPQQQEIWRSASAISLTLPSLPPADTGQFRLQQLQTLNDIPLFQLNYGIIWAPEAGSERNYHVYLLQSAGPMQAEISAFRRSLWQWFSAIGIILIVLQGVLMRWGLSPLRQLAGELSHIETGKQSHLRGHYPIELESVTHNLNLLIENERRQRQRYRDTLADLAHSLKTPLAILRGLHFNSQNLPEDQRSLNEQVNRMDEIISHQLRRSSTKAGQQPALSMHPVALAPLADTLLRALSKVYADKKIRCANNIPADISYRGDEHDLMEVFGNLLDNAFKASRNHVAIEAHHHQQYLIIAITDDGTGIPTELRNTVLERGSRADTQHPGQGLGLTVAQDIIKSYQGRMTLGSSNRGGAQIQVELPLR